MQKVALTVPALCLAGMPHIKSSESLCSADAFSAQYPDELYLRHLSGKAVKLFQNFLNSILGDTGHSGGPPQQGHHLTESEILGVPCTQSVGRRRIRTRVRRSSIQRISAWARGSATPNRLISPDRGPCGPLGTDSVAYLHYRPTIRRYRISGHGVTSFLHSHTPVPVDGNQNRSG